MVKRAGAFPDVRSVFKYLPVVRPSGPLNQRMVVFNRRQDVHFDTTQRRRTQCGQKGLVGDEIRRPDSDALPRHIQRAQKDPPQAVKGFIRAGFDAARQCRSGRLGAFLPRTWYPGVRQW